MAEDERGKLPPLQERTREWAEGALQASGLTPEKLGAAEWELAVREALAYEPAEPATGHAVAGDRQGRQTLSREPLMLTPERLAELQQHQRARATAAQLEAAEARMRLPSGNGCERCDGARFVYVPRPDGRPHLAVPCVCMPLAERAHFAGIPRRFHDASLAAFRRLEGKTRARAWAETWNGRDSVVFHSLDGEELWGTGKTHLGVALLLRQLEAGRPARFVYVPDFLDELRSRFEPGAPEQAHDYADRIADEPLLMLDDLGAEKVTDWTREVVRTLLDRRWRRELTTVVTTNATSEAELAEAIGGAVVSRLREADWIPVAGEDMRGRADE